MASQTNRREFLQRLGVSAVGGASFLSGLTKMSLVQAAAQNNSSQTGFKALVCIFLFGGNDSFNCIVPSSTAEYQTYASARQSLAVARNSLLPVTSARPNSYPVGFHPNLTELRDLFTQNKLAVLANCGTLLQPVTRSQFFSNSVPIPAQLFSHNDQQEQWQSARLQGSSTSGWAGRMFDLLNSNTGSIVPGNLSLVGSNLFQTGQRTQSYSVNAAGVELFEGLGQGSAVERVRRQTLEAMLQRSQPHLFMDEYSKLQLQARDLAEFVSQRLAQQSSLQTQFPTSELGSQLQMVAKMIQARASLNMNRQIFFVGMGGFDTHGAQLSAQPRLLQQLNASLGAFYRATVELGVQDQVTSFTASEFGRTLSSNGDGSDHGWGGHSFIFGGCVRGGDIYGTLPNLQIGGPDDVEAGRLIPTTSLDQYGAALASWFGVSNSDLGTIFPNLQNFNAAPLGFL